LIEDRVKELGSRNKEEPRKMKDSGVEWIGEIPEEWEIGKVKQAFYRKKAKAMQENPTILTLARSGVKIRDISNNEGQLAESYYNYNPVEEGDFLLNPMDLYSGANCNVSKVSGVISPAYINLRARNGFIPQYYDYYFKVQYWAMALFAHGRGVSFDNRWTLNNETLMNYYIPIPEMYEQQAIADYLDSKVALIDNIIEKTKQSIEDYKKYKQSLITETVTKGLNPDVEMKDSGIEWIDRIPGHWEIKMLKYVTKLNQKCLSENTDEDYVFRYVDIGSVSLENGIERYEKMRFRDAPSRARRVVANGDVIISTVRTYLKAITNIRDDSDIIVSTGFAVLTPFQVYAKYLEFFCKCDYFAETVSAHSYGVSYPAINASDILKFKITLPPIEEQQQIADYLDRKCLQIDKIIDQKKTLINELETYKKSLIYECVTGKRDVG